MKIACLYSLCWYRCYDDEDDDDDDDDDDDNDDDGDDDDDDDGGGGGGGLEEFDFGVVDDVGTRPQAIASRKPSMQVPSAQYDHSS